MKPLFYTLLFLTLSPHLSAQKKSPNKIIYIDYFKEKCNANSKSLCFRYRTSAKHAWKILPENSLLKFSYLSGYEYKLLVKEIRKGQQGISYECIKVLTKKEPKNMVVRGAEEPEQKGLPLSSQWILESFENKNYKKAITKNTYLTISKNQTEVSGNGGCNTFGGKVRTSGNNISFSELMRTEMYCEESQEQEDLFLKNLEETTHYKIISGELFLYKNQTLLMTLESWR